MQMTCTVKEEVCIAHGVPDWISNLFLHEVALTCYSLRNKSVLFLCKVHLGGWSQYEACKHASLVLTIEINWKTTFSWGKVKENSNEGCIGCLVTIFHSQNQTILCEISQGFAKVFWVHVLGLCLIYTSVYLSTLQISWSLHSFGRFQVWFSLDSIKKDCIL